MIDAHVSQAASSLSSWFFSQRNFLSTGGLSDTLKYTLAVQDRLEYSTIRCLSYYSLLFPPNITFSTRVYGAIISSII